MRMPMSWSLPNSDENDNFHLPTDEVFFREVLRVRLICRFVRLFELYPNPTISETVPKFAVSSFTNASPIRSEVRIVTCPEYQQRPLRPHDERSAAVVHGQIDLWHGRE